MFHQTEHLDSTTDTEEDRLATVAHYIMVHYSQPSQPKSGPATKKVFHLAAGLK